MFGMKKRAKAAFEGSVYDQDSHVADIELDGSGKYEGNRKMWRFRVLNGRLDSNEQVELRMNNRNRNARVVEVSNDDDHGYVEFF